MVHPARIRALNDHAVVPARRYVLYWMVTARRLECNLALEHAVSLAIDLRLPLVIFEPLRLDYRWASERLHQFVIDGMADHARSLEARRATYVPHVERVRGDGRALLDVLARDAAVIVTDDYPAFFLPRMHARAAARLPARIEAVDSNGLLPMRGWSNAFRTAFAFRAAVQRELRPHLESWPGSIRWDALPAPVPLHLPEGIPPATARTDLDSPARLLASLPIDKSVAPVSLKGGEAAASATLRRFIDVRLARYANERNHPDLAATSGLSPYLHFGHISAHQVFEAVVSAERWTSRRLAERGGGKREGWWGLSPSAEAFLDQLITWRELGFAAAVAEPDSFDRFSGLPSWARSTLEAHAGDERPFAYAPAELEAAGTHDRVWNAAERELLREGTMHNYLRMLWGKKILEWSPTAEHALETMIALMNRHALDGRDPNSYTGYTWTLGRYDRPWAPERPIFGTVRYMSSDNAVRKLRMRQYLERYA
jgi:deoxyribodipyrimidine photo-lyase